MRIYYGETKDLKDYIENETHKVVALKEGSKNSHPFRLTNNTQFTLIVSESRWGRETIAKTVKPQETITIISDIWSNSEYKIVAQEDNGLECSFSMARGRMRGRNYDETKRDYYIAPVFKSGNIEIVNCKNCGVDLGIVPQYTIKPIESPECVLKIKNCTKYNVIISIENQVVQRIESRQTAEVAIPFHAVLYVDTETEEVLWQDWFDKSEKEIISGVNGCCIDITSGYEPKYHHLYGPDLTTHYVHFLYASNSRDEDVDICIWCHVFDED